MRKTTLTKTAEGLHRHPAAILRPMLALAVMALAACAGQPVRQAPPIAAAAAIAAQEAREVALRADLNWSLAGRVALSNGRQGGSGRLDWQQAGARYAVSLSAPVTRQSWRLSGEPGGAVLEGLEGGARHGADPGQLLHESTGWEIPVAALPDWLRGVRAADQGPATLAFGADGRLATMEQGGWRIAYADWRLPEPAAPGTAAVAPVALPHRIEATRGQARVRLLVDAWDEEARVP
jgi:outer membrane lipoprotein LolB